MSDRNIVYLRLRNRHFAKPNAQIFLSEIAQIIAPKQYESAIKGLSLYQITAEDQHLVVLDLIHVIKKIKEEFPNLDIRSIGSPEIIIEIVTAEMKKQPSIWLIAFVWTLLFIGSGLAIMNFHHDVSMQEVHQRIYYLITGIENKKPLLLQIPYSFGLGFGMILFFNHIFKKKINEEPSPLEVEMFLYQKNLDDYVVLNENKENRKKD